MTNELNRCMKKLELFEADAEKVKQLINEAGTEFPCLACPSKDDCQNFRWFIKWFGE